MDKTLSAGEMVIHVEPTKFWFVWRKNGHVPRVAHESYALAEREAIRLSKKHPGWKFIVLESMQKFSAVPEWKVPGFEVVPEATPSPAPILPLAHPAEVRPKVGMCVRFMSTDGEALALIQHVWSETCVNLMVLYDNATPAISNSVNYTADLAASGQTVGWQYTDDRVVTPV